MKQLFLIFCISLLVSCNDSTTEVTPTPANPENVNGNVPDSSNVVSPSQPLLKDSLPRDSVR